jgi:DNA-binding SARP family transcriptional activator/Tfp pilus assembly protein PilF
VPPAAPALAAPPDATRSGVRFGVLGPLLVYDESGTAHPLAVAQHRRLLAILLLRANRVVSFQELADSLWDGNPPAGFRPTLRNYVRLVRQAVGPELAARLVTRPPGYLIELGDDELDMSRFTRLCLEGGDSVREQAWDRAHDQLAAALALWRGPAFSDVPSDLIQDIEVPHLTGLRLQAWEWRIEADLQLGRHDELVDELRRLVGEHRLRERFWEQLMLALYRSGRQADALAAYTRVRKILAEELGVEPGPALQEAQRRILSADAALIDGPAPAGGSARGRTAAPAPAQLPLDVRGFAGRDRELAALDAIATGAETEPTAVAITAVSGTAGVGKTALAVHWARRVADRFPDGQLYLNLRGFDREGTVMSEAEAVRALLDSLELPAERIPVGFDAQTALLRSLLTGRRMLILLDNARDADQVRPLLPGAPGCLVLVTSRNQLAGLIVADDAHSVTLDVLSEAESIDVLAHRLGRGRVDAERAAATEIVAACARLPLALGVVAARAAMHPGFPLSVLADELRQTRGGLDAFAGGDTASDVRAVLSWSYRTLSPAAASLFRLIALHTGPDITAPAAASLAARPPGTVRPLLAELARAHLVAEHAPGRYASHDLLRAYATELVQVHDAPAEREAAVHRVLAHYLHTALTADALLVPHWDLVDPPMLPAGVTPEPIADPGRALDWFSGEHAVLLAAAGQAAAVGRDEYTAHLAGALMNFLDRRGYWEDLAATQRLALAAADRLGDLALNAHVRRSLARAYARTGRYDEALGHLRPALAISIELGDARSQARTHLSLAWVQELRGDYAVALEHARRVLDLGRVMNHQPTEASALNTIGWLYSRLDDDQRAVAVCQRSLRIFEELADIFGQAFTLDSLGFAYHRMGRFDEAVDAYSRSADLLRELGDRYNEAIARRNLGDAYAEAGQATAARAAWRRSVDLLDEMSHPDAEPVRARLSTGAVPAQAGAQ